MMGELGLEIDSILSLGMDGPNVYDFWGDAI